MRYSPQPIDWGCNIAHAPVAQESGVYMQFLSILWKSLLLQHRAYAKVLALGQGNEFFDIILSHGCILLKVGTICQVPTFSKNSDMLVKQTGGRFVRPGEYLDCLKISGRSLTLTAKMTSLLFLMN
jgi:hypothetical protein